MVRIRGYALIETLLASVILVSGIVGVASVFTVTAGVSIRNQQRTVATLLLCDKMEQLKSGGSPNGGGLDPLAPVSGYMEYVRVGADGTIVVDSTDSQAPYLRLWQIQGSNPQTATVALFGRFGATPRIELARASAAW